MPEAVGLGSNGSRPHPGPAGATDEGAGGLGGAATAVAGVDAGADFFRGPHGCAQSATTTSAPTKTYVRGFNPPGFPSPVRVIIAPYGVP